MFRYLKKPITVIVAIATILWTAGVPLWPLKIAAPSAQADASTAVSLFQDGIFYQIPPQGEVVPASSSALPLFSFQIRRTSAATLTSVKVNLVDGGAGITVAATDITRISVYKKTTWETGGGMYSFPIEDRIGTTTTIQNFVSGVSANNTITISGDTSIPTDYMAAEYYVTISTSANWSGADQVSYTLPANWLTVFDGTLGSACPVSGNVCQPVGDQYYATAPDGFIGEQFNVEMVEYMGLDGSGNKEVNVRFTTEVNQTAATTRTNYNIGGTNPLADPAPVMMSPHSVKLSFASTVTITSNQTQLTIDKDITDMKGNVLSAVADLTMMIMGGGGGSGGAPLYISEVMIGTASSGQQEFIELYNPTGAVVNFGTMPVKVWVVYASSTVITHTKIKDLVAGEVAANGYYLIAPAEYAGISPAADATYNITSLGLGAEGALRTNAGVYLSMSDSSNIAVIDRLGWGTATGEMSYGMAKCSSSDPENCTVANNGKSLERKANPSSTAASMAAGGADAANGNSYMSHNNQYDFVQRTTADPQKTGTTETPGGMGFGANNNYPFINHQPIPMASATQDLIVMADFMDDSGQITASNAKLYYRFHDNDGNPANGIVPESTWNPVSGTQTATGSNMYRFTVPTATLDANKDLDYFLRAYDGTNYTCLPPGTSGTSASCNASTNLIGSTEIPFYINVSAAGGSGVISGTVQTSGGTGMPNVMVFAEGMPFVATTNASGFFTLTGLPDGVYDLRARGGSYTVSGTTANYLDGFLSGIYLNSNNTSSTSNTITLIQGVVENFSGTSSDQESPLIRWSMPPDNGMIPKSENLVVVFDRAMQSGTITGGTATTDNVYLMTPAGQVVAGTVSYYADTSGRPAGLPPDLYLMIYDPTTDLTPGGSYTVVIKDTVLGQNGKRLMGNRPSGGHSINFQVAMDFGSGGEGGANAGSYTFGSGASFPPYVIGTAPGGGGFSVPLNTNIYITFNKPMSASSINTTNIKLYSVSNPYQANETETAVASYTVTQNTNGDIAILDPASNLTANTRYRVKVLSNCTSADGTPLSNSNNGEQFRLDFETGSSTDSVAPTVAGTYPNNNDTGVPNNLPAVTVGFSEGMNPSTINAATAKLKFGTSVVPASAVYDVGAREARIMPTNALRPGATYTIQVVAGASGVKDMVGNALASNYEVTFMTDTTADATAPYIEFARCDDFACSVTFSEPMINARADDAINYAASVLKPANYAVRRDPDGANTAISTANGRTEYDQMNNTVRLEGLAGLAANDQYQITVSNVKDKAGNTIAGTISFRGRIESSMGTGGMMGPGGPGPMMGPATMMDASGNQFGSVGFTGSQYQVGGGPVAGSDMMAGMGGAMGFDFGGRWEKPTNVMPMNMMAGQTTMYFVEFSSDNAIPAGGTIKLTFPSGTDVSLAERVAESQSMPNKDLNGPAPGTVKIAGNEATQSGGADDDGVSVNRTARTVTVTIDVANDGVAAGESIMFDLKGIKNPTVPKSFDSNGYTVDIKTFHTSGALIESKTSFPYFINEAGNYTLSGTVTATGATTGTASVYLDSWMTGPMETTVNFATNANGTAAYSFTGLPQGDYHLRTEPSITLGVIDYSGYMKPEPVFVNSGTCTNSVCTKNFSLTSASSGYPLSVYIVGDFSAMSSTDRNVDIFAGSMDGFAVKTVTLNATNYTAAVPYNTTVYLPSLDSDTTDLDQWHVGMGPAMPKGTKMMGPPSMPAWIPPSDIEVSVTGVPASATWTERSAGVISTPTNAADDGKIAFNVTSASNQIIGYVIDTAGNVIANVDIDAHRTQGGFGMPAHAQTDTGGKFVLKVTTGIYEVNAWMPGMPPSQGKVVDVRDNSVNTDGNTTADVYKRDGTFLVIDATSGYGPETNVNGVITEFFIKMAKSSTTISGKLLDDSNNPVAYAPVWAYNQTTGEHLPSGTDSSGNYTIYAGNGNWNVGAFIPGIGDAFYANNPVAVAGSNRSDINIRPLVTNLATITGAVTIGGAAVSNAGVWVDGIDSNGRPYNNHTNTNSAGAYRLRVPGGTSYVLKAWTPEYGELESITLGTVTAGTAYTGGTDYTDFTVAVGSLHTLTVNFSNYSNLGANTEAFVDVFDPTARKGNHKRIADLSTTSSTSLAVKAGENYEIHSFIPGLGGMSATCQNSTNITCTAGSGGAPDTWAISGNASVTIAIPDLTNLYTFNVTVTDGTNNLSEVFVWLGNETLGFHAGTPTNNSGVATLKVPAGTYKLGGDKPGYTGPAPAAVVTSTDSACVNNVCTKTLIFSTNPYTIKGTIYADTNANGVYDSGTDRAISNAMVWADKINSATNFTFAGGWTGDQTDPDGSYELSVSDGVWLVRAIADGYQETKYEVSGTVTPISINGASQIGKNIALTARASFTAKAPKSMSITPASGGTVDDSGNTGVKVIIPPSAMGSDTSAATLNIQETYTVPKTSAAIPLGEKGKEITASNSSGQAITTFSGSVNIAIDYTDVVGDLPAGVDESKLKLAYYDGTSSQWVELPSSQDLTNNTLSGNTTHLTTYAVVLSADTTAPTTPGTPSSSSTGATAVTFTWSASSDTGWGLAGYEVTRSTNGSTFSTISGGGVGPNDTGEWNAAKLVTSATYTDTGLTAGTTYYYQVIAWDNASPGHNHSASSATLAVTPRASGGGTFAPSSPAATSAPSTPSVIPTTPTPTAPTTTQPTVVTPATTPTKSARVLQIERIVSEAKSVAKAVVSEIVSLVNTVRDLAKEQTWGTAVAQKVIGTLKPVAEVRYAITNFVAYGTPESLKLGEGERAGVVNSFKEAFEKLPATDADWEDILKIANGRWPSQRSETKEALAEQTFEEIYLRAPDRSKPNDDAAVVVMAYGLRPVDRNLDSEKAAIKSFKRIFGQNPETATEWDTVRAIAYSGATREAPTVTIATQ